MNLNIPHAWQSKLETECQKDYFNDILIKLDQRYKEGATIFPNQENIFHALESCAPEDVKVVILGQDPYHGPNQAHGLSFSVQKGVRQPPSLLNIFKELKNDLNIDPPSHGCLDQWAQQGVLLLNSVLTVEKGKAGSHANMGWETFTDQIIKIVNEQDQKVCFVLWGAYAQKKAEFVNSKKHLVLKTTHPSPFSAHKGFLGSKPFSKINKWRMEQNMEPINWNMN